MTPIRWGILSTGNIARQFARGLQALPDARLTAVGSRTTEAAQAFAREFGVANIHSSYEALAHDPEVDVIYIGTPHPMHHANCMLCLGAGKAVLCEKPFTINASEAAAVIGVARQRNLFLMEAMWTRFLPLYVRLRELLAEGVIGEVQMLEADFGFAAPFNPSSRLFDPALGGGALLDVGIYPVALASMIFGPPERITSAAQLGSTGVDEYCTALLGYSGGRTAFVSAATRTQTPHVATINGTRGRITLHAPWWRGTRMTVAAAGKTEVTYDVPLTGNGYNYEAAEVMRCLREGRTESATMPLDETLAIMRTLDTIREPWGLRYPMEG
ncbi:MAG: Gfo/Idh/MocA family oxidoreductase [Chloroflexaceae bacterium]|jgi:predicted dehydrogenase|nr:Gfo/Idh/MocA family oxidoreductase [Chloroflexaceae bacterium]